MEPNPFTVHCYSAATEGPVGLIIRPKLDTTVMLPSLESADLVVCNRAAATNRILVIINDYFPLLMFLLDVD